MFAMNYLKTFQVASVEGDLVYLTYYIFIIVKFIDKIRFLKFQNIYFIKLLKKL